MKKEIDAMKFRCTVCGYVADGAAPDTCPNCKAPKEKFEEIKDTGSYLDIIDWDKVGCAKDSEFAADLKMQFEGECAEVGMYIAMARQAEREGYAEIAETMKRIAFEEAVHAAKFCELIGGISESTEENLIKLVQGESGANHGKKKIATASKAANNDAVHDAIHEACKDEARHACAFNGLLKRYFNK